MSSHDDKNGVLLPTAVYREVIRLTEGIQQSQTKYDAIDQLHAFARFVLKHAPPSTTPTLDGQWCMDAFWRVNPGRNATVPSLYLLDFAREVLRVYGAARSAIGPSTTPRKCSKCCFGCSDAEIERCRNTSPERWTSASTDGTTAK